MPNFNMIQALNDAHKVAMRADDDIVVFGEDIGYFGGVFRVTEGLQREFGKTRVFDATIVNGPKSCNRIFITRINLTPPNESKFPFKLNRFNFPLDLRLQ